MARRQGIKIQNNFIGGLITQTTPLKFPENACTDASNCLFDEFGRVKRRPSLDIEEGYTIFTATKTNGEVFTEFLWQAVSGSGTLSFLVQQQGATLHFYDVSTSTNGVSSRKKTFTVDLQSFLASDGTLSPSSTYCSFASGRGDLIVTNSACDPFFVTYNEDSDTITTERIILKQRDFVGLDDGLTVNERPTMSVASLRTDNGEHYYNLLNQGWHQGRDNGIVSALHQWDTARTDLPSNADYIALYRASTTDAFDNTTVDVQTPGNRYAPKGHFILDVANPNRYQAILDDGWASGVFDTTTQEINRSSGTVLNGGFSNPAYAFDGTNFVASVAGTSTTNYLGKTISSSIFSVKVVGGDKGFESSTSASTITIKLYGKSGVTPPSSYSDGTLLGTTTLSDYSLAEATIISSDSVTTFDHIWINITSSLTSGTISVREIKLYTVESTGLGTGGQKATVRVGKVAFFAGRAWYTGLNSDGYNNSLFFSQIIERSAQYGLCYQVNDPTGENFYDLLPNDGGVIKIPEMANVVHLHVYQKSLLVFATNGVWLIRGSNGGFSATDFSVAKLSSTGTQSGQSFVDVKGLPLWWAEDGIYVVKYNPQFDSFSVESLTDTTIKKFFLEIPVYNRQFVKGSYDSLKQIVYWIYNNDPSPDPTVFNSCLVMNSKTGSFFPWSWTNTTPTVRGITYAVDSIGVTDPKVKLVTTASINSSQEKLFFSEFKENVFYDWNTYSIDFNSPSDKSDYSSYFITGYVLDGETEKFFQPNYLFVFSDQLENSSLLVQAIFDFTNSGNSGKWSTRQQAYNNSTSYRDVIIRRLKVRGQGRALQLKFSSSSGAPFSIIGWSINESVNNGI